MITCINLDSSRGDKIVDPNQLASSEASISGSTLVSKECNKFDSYLHSALIKLNIACNCDLGDSYCRTLVKSAYRKTNFPISRPKHMLGVLKRTFSMRRFS